MSYQSNSSAEKIATCAPTVIYIERCYPEKTTVQHYACTDSATATMKLHTCPSEACYGQNLINPGIIKCGTSKGAPQVPHTHRSTRPCVHLTTDSKPLSVSARMDTFCLRPATPALPRLLQTAKTRTNASTAWASKI